MRALRRALLAWTVALPLACGAPRAAQAPTAPSTATPPPAPREPATARVVGRPENVLAWVHVDDPDALLDLVRRAKGPQWALLEWMELFDLRQPVDVAVVVTPSQDFEPALRIAVKDTRSLLEKAGKLGTLEQDGDRLRFAGESRFACDVSRPADGFVCGSPAALDGAAEWLRSRPTPRSEDFARSGRGRSIVRVTAYPRPYLDFQEATHSSPRPGEELLELLGDVETLSFELAADGDRFAFATTLRARASSSRITKALLAPPTSPPPIASFQRIWQETSAAVFSAGGSALARLLDERSKARDPSGGGGPALDPKLVELLGRPLALGYGVRADRARAALDAARKAKSEDEVARALEALDEYVVASVGADVAAVRAFLTSAVVRWNVREKARAPSVRESWSLRSAPATLGLASGSLLLDHRAVARRDAAAAALAPSVKGLRVPMTTRSTLFVPDGPATWVVAGGDDGALVETAKRLLASSAPPATKEALFERPGVHLGGYLTTRAGAFGMQALLLGSSRRGPPPSPEILTELERHLAAPRAPLPFVLSATPRGAGGVAALEMQGDRSAFESIAGSLGDLSRGGDAVGLVVAAYEAWSALSSLGAAAPPP